MDKNKQLLYCILGSFILALLKSPIFKLYGLEMFTGVYGGYFCIDIVLLLTNIISLAGYILLVVFSSILIVRNIR